MAEQQISGSPELYSDGSRKTDFKNKPHLEDQFRLNADVIKLIDFAEINSESPAVVRSYLQRARNLLQGRQKDLKIAESSKHGFATVWQYHLFEDISHDPQDRRSGKTGERPSQHR